MQMHSIAEKLITFLHPRLCKSKDLCMSEEGHIAKYKPVHIYFIVCVYGFVFAVCVLLVTL